MAKAVAMTTDYAAPDPAIAEMVYRDEVESDEQYKGRYKDFLQTQGI